MDLRVALVVMMAYCPMVTQMDRVVSWAYEVGEAETLIALPRDQETVLDGERLSFVGVCGCWTWTRSESGKAEESAMK